MVVNSTFSRNGKKEMRKGGREKRKEGGTEGLNTVNEGYLQKGGVNDLSE